MTKQTEDRVAECLNDLAMLSEVIMGCDRCKTKFTELKLKSKYPPQL